MSGDGGGTAPAMRAPDRAERMAFYRRRHARALRRLRGRAAVYGVVSAALAIILLIATDGSAAWVVLALAFGALMGALAWGQQLAGYDRQMTAAQPLADLPAFDALAFHWATAHDVADLDAALDEVITAANRWTEQDRADYLLAASLPGVVAGSFDWLVRDRNTGELIGGVSCDDDQIDRRVVSMGLWLAAGHRGHGRGAEVLERAVPTAIALLRGLGPGFRGDPDQITISTGVDHVAMRRTAERAGGIEAGEYSHAFPDGSRAPSVRYRFRAEEVGLEARPPVPAAGREPSGRRKVVLLVTAGVALIVVGLISSSILQGRDDDRREAARSDAEYPRPDLVIAALDSAGEDPDDIRVDPSIVGELRELQERMAPTTIPGTVIDSGSSYARRFAVYLQARSTSTKATLAAHYDGEEPDLTSVRVENGSERIAVAKIPISHGSYLLGFVPRGTASVVYQAPGEEPVAVLVTDLSEDGPADAPLLVAQWLHFDQVAGSTITVTDADDHETVTRLS